MYNGLQFIETNCIYWHEINVLFKKKNWNKGYKLILCKWISPFKKEIEKKKKRIIDKETL